MRSDIPSTLVVLIFTASVSVAVPARAAHAQDQISFRVLQAVGTPDEKPLIDAITSRVKTKFTGDLTFAKRVNDAFIKRDFTTATSLIAPVAQLTVEQVTLGTQLKTAARHNSRDDYFRLASMPPNPFYILITTENHAICFGLKATCRDAIRKAGYEPNN